MLPKLNLDGDAAGCMMQDESPREVWASLEQQFDQALAAAGPTFVLKGLPDDQLLLLSSKLINSQTSHARCCGFLTTALLPSVLSLSRSPTMPLMMAILDAGSARRPLDARHANMPVSNQKCGLHACMAA